MTIRAGLRPALAVAVLVGLAACGERGAAGPATPTTVPAEPAAADGLVLRVEYTGGFVSPSATVGRLPLVSVYADGRVISEGPQIDIFPGPALPGVVRPPRCRVSRLARSGSGQRPSLPSRSPCVT